jgi:hypothetical protein
MAQVRDTDTFPAGGRGDEALGFALMAPDATGSQGLLEKILRHAQARPWQPLYLTAIGMLVGPLSAGLRGNDGSDWLLVPVFLVVLMALRAVPAFVRHVLPFSTELQAHWFQHRVLAKHYDSYQWRKLLWFGLGLGCYMALFNRADGAAGLLALACVLSGSLGHLAWRRVAGTKPVLAILSSK